LPVLPAQALLPWVLVQALPHAAQFVAVPSAVSQPVAAVQSAKPALQPTSVQLPLLQDAVAFARMQALPHVPQSVSVVKLRSQPFSFKPSQSPQPVVHTGEQPVVALQLVEPCAFVHDSPHARQFESVPSAVSQPVAAVQSAKPVAQLTAVQLPPPHDSDEPSISQTVSQAPQSSRLQIDVSQPFCGLPSQLSQPALHVGWQPLLALQAVLPWALVQALPQVKQLSTLPSAVSQPAFALQSA
jgi:hypothetical protein